MIGEVWREVPSQPQFMVSSEGRFMVKPYFGVMPYGGKRPYGGKPHFGTWNKQDARFIVVYKGHTHKVARLICEAFHGEPPAGKPVCMHLDENAANNRPDNLAWGSQKENLNATQFKDYKKMKPGDQHPVYGTKGNYNSKLTVPQIHEIRADNRTHKEIATEYEIAASTVCEIKQRKTWGHV